MQIEKIELDKLIFIDIETVAQKEKFEQLNLNFQELWAEKSNQKYKNDDLSPAETFEKYAAIYAEFGQIVCISVGMIVPSTADEPTHFRVKSYTNTNETALLNDFTALITKLQTQDQHKILVGHNIKEFDIPYLCRRMLANGIKIPTLIDMNGLKPWEIIHIDTLQLWRFGDYKSYTSLKLLAAVLGIQSPKDDIDGAMVGKVYYETQDLQRIARYCEKDVITVAQIILKLKRKNLIQTQNISIA